MSTAVRFVPDDCSVDHIGEIMSQARLSRLLVLDQGGRLAGVVSIAELIVHSPGKNALETARSIYAREMSERSQGHPHEGPKPKPEYFRGTRDDLPSIHDGAGENAARSEAAAVAHGGTNHLKEFPA